MAKLFLLLTILPLIELALLLLLSKYTSITSTLLFVVLTGIAGAILLHYQGWATYRNLRRDLAEGRMPTDSLLDGLMIFLAGVLLITPGVLTDLFGMTLLLPPCRRLYRRWATAWIKSKFQIRSFTGSERSQVIDSYVIDHKPSGDDIGKND